ncbi:MAG: heme-copper oxidase subunit III [Pyrinomonadaceae bacterium]
MDIGTAEIIEPVEEPRKRRGSISGGTPPNGGNGGRNPGGGGNDDDGGGNAENYSRSADPAREPFVPSKSRVLTGFLLLVVLMTFGGLIGAYIVIATNKAAEWQPFDLPIPVWISTLLILASSVVYHLGKVAVDKNDQPAAKKWFVTTTVFGAAFISSQILAWLALNSRGLYMEGNPYAGFFYILTAVHAVHVLGGIIALGTILLRNLTPTERLVEISKRQTLAQVVGWYWHFMGALWLVLFVLLGFWK